MLTEHHIEEIRAHLEKAENPLFFFDDDHDGLVSYLLLKKKYSKGRGVCVKASKLAEDIYVRKVNELNPDRVFILDKPVLNQELLDQIHAPIVWIDHHEPLQRNNVYYYNPMCHEPKDNRPTSYWCYRVAQENLWIALVGIIGDWYVPEDLMPQFEYKDLLNGKTTPPSIIFDSEYGKLVKIFTFLLKGKTSDVRKYISILETIENPLELLRQTTPKAKFLYKKFEAINKEYEKLLQKALATKYDNDLLLFVYHSSKTSFTGTLSNELLHRAPAKLIIVARKTADDMRISIRSTTVKVLPLLKKSLEHVEGYGGGHEMACGASIKLSDFEKFIDFLKTELRKH